MQAVVDIAEWPVRAASEGVLTAVESSDAANEIALLRPLYDMLLADEGSAEDFGTVCAAINAIVSRTQPSDCQSPDAVAWVHAIGAEIDMHHLFHGPVLQDLLNLSLIHI